MRSLVKGQLDASRWESSGFVGERAATDLAELAEAAAAVVDSPRHDVRVDVAGPVMVDLDVARMRQVLQNLLENAVKYSPNGGSVTVRVRAEGGEAHLSVSDEGIGIPESSLPAIFERFNRGALTSDRTIGGMGLGLFLSKRIVDGHQGRIWAESTPGVGSTFHVALPLTVERSPAPETQDDVPAREVLGEPPPLPNEAAPRVDLRAPAGGEAGDV
jgi:signal transduction histidine kinase